MPFISAYLFLLLKPDPFSEHQTHISSTLLDILTWLSFGGDRIKGTHGLPPLPPIPLAYSDPCHFQICVVPFQCTFPSMASVLSLRKRNQMVISLPPTIQWFSTMKSKLLDTLCKGLEYLTHSALQPSVLLLLCTQSPSLQHADIQISLMCGSFCQLGMLLLVTASLYLQVMFPGPEMSSPTFSAQKFLSLPQDSAVISSLRPPNVPKQS